MTEIEVPCPTGAGTGDSTCEDQHTGTNMDTCRTCGGRRTIPARPGESRETSWPFAVPGTVQPAAPATPSPEGEVEGLVERLIKASYAAGIGYEGSTSDDQEEMEQAIDAARAALLSRISPSPVNTSGRDPDGSGLSQIETASGLNPSDFDPSRKSGAKDLWCMNIVGPDDVFPAPDFWTALVWSAELNISISKRAIAEKWADDEHMPLAYAVPARWPWSEETHAAGLKAELAARASHEDRRRVAQAMEARQGGDAEGGSVEDDSATPSGDVPKSSPTPSLQTQGAINPPDRREEGGAAPAQSCSACGMPYEIVVECGCGYVRPHNTPSKSPASPPPSQKEQGDA